MASHGFRKLHNLIFFTVLGIHFKHSPPKIIAGFNKKQSLNMKTLSFSWFFFSVWADVCSVLAWRRGPFKFRVAKLFLIAIHLSKAGNYFGGWMFEHDFAYTRKRLSMFYMNHFTRRNLLICSGFTRVEFSWFVSHPRQVPPPEAPS